MPVTTHREDTGIFRLDLSGLFRKAELDVAQARVPRRDALERRGWRIKGPAGAAAELGLKPATLYARMKKLGIPLRG